MKRVILLMSFILLSLSLTMAQTRKVTGIVLSSDDRQPVIGASVLVIGTSQGTLTDIEGRFEIPNVPNSAKQLRISFIGMNTLTVNIQPYMEIHLQFDTEHLDEIVVTAQGLTRKQKSLGYATQKVNKEELEQVRQTDLNNALVGKVSGIRFLGGSGAKFDAGKVVLRGTSSLTNASGSEPIYVIDGVITNVNSLNMDDVESINVLKGPAATALYGSRGGTGAIIITTKGMASGDGPQTEVSVSHTTAWEKAYIHANMQNKYGGGYKGADGEMSIFKYDPAKDPDYLKQMDGVPYYDYSNDASWGPRLDGREYAPWYAWDPTHPKFGQTAKWQSEGNLKDLFRTGLTNTTNVSVGRSSNDHSTRISFTNSNRKGIAPNSSADRRFLSVKTMFKPLDKLTVSLDYKYTYRKNINGVAEGYGGTGNVFYTYLQWGHRNVNFNDLKDYRRPDGSMRSWNITSPRDLTPAFHNNPYAMYQEIVNKNTSQWNVFSGDANYNIWKNLNIGFRVNGNIRNTFSDQKIPMNLLGDISSYDQAQSNLNDLQFQGRLTWNDNFINNRLGVEAALFIESRNYHMEEIGAFTRDGLILDGYFNTSASTGLPGGSNYSTRMKERSIYGTGTVAWDDTYFLDFSVRNDWSSTLPPDNNSYLYGGVSGAVLLNKFIKANWLDFLKVRGSMAQVGSSMNPYQIYSNMQAIDNNGNTVKYGSLSEFWYDLNKKTLDIKPTISTSYEIGAEFRMFGNRLWGDFNYYNRDSKDQILNVNTTSASGYTSRKMNAGLIRNRGIEFSLGGRPIDTKDWTWDINGNLSRNRNKLVRLTDDQDSYQIYWMGFSTRVYSYAEVGKPIGVIRGSTWKKDENGNIILAKRSTPSSLGEYIPQLDTSAQKELGNVQPDLTGGFSTSLRFKDFRLGASFDFQVGGNIVSITNMFGEGSGLLRGTDGLNDKGKELRAPVSEGGGVRIDGVVQNANGEYEPVTTYIDANYYYQSRKSLIFEDYVYDASYLKMRELSLTYDVPSSLLRKLNWGIKRASVSFIAQNPWLIYSSVPNIDPSESGGATSGYIEGGQAASTRSFGCTVSLTF
ncbi:SusC/RagA family TonB-linked outer membrane protein [Bacteroides sp.]|uniref:SusC/RagA family TonB-linked outer membrane protein n=1 Tax=Bacteroides sp. TaxID=29523 RepID=UPI00258B04AB|nr:SusC/RagA family TonB-linked outer membrane protein [Bacteroides sp.]